MFDPAGTARRSARAAARSAASWSPRIPAMTESTASAAATQCGSRSSVASRLAYSAAGIANYRYLLAQLGLDEAAIDTRVRAAEDEARASAGAPE